MSDPADPRSLRAAVVGGSIGGCAAVLALHRAGWRDITVYERTGGDLAERGVGVAVIEPRYAELAAAGLLDPAMPWAPVTRREWYVRGGTAPLGRLIHTEEHFGPVRTCTWGALWRGLRTAVADRADFRAGTPVASVTVLPGGAEVRPAAAPGREARADRHDLVIGADGYRSVVREAVHAGIRPRYAGYWAWRGAFPEDRLPDAGLWGRTTVVYAVFDGGHLVVYRIPGPAGGTHVNWVLYAAPPPDAPVVDAEPGSLPPGTLSGALHTYVTGLAADRLPPFWARMIALTAPGELFTQPLYDFWADPGVSGRVALLGDAASVARPHTGAGAVKALQDAAGLGAALAASPTDPGGALLRYDAARAARGRELVDLGRRLGRALVEEARDWSSIDAAGLADVWRHADASGLFGGRAR
ncbi:FAD-dependent monooxygenase [Streptomyces yaizuensis]|uniref:FAD-dependent monooxygenase n=1 Tax=Streptomyces yaizuensis TaxID=2989713 RepID=A0ABQ5P5U4_9ACTN|nr:FAD-dependent monooxygenase [Streptomyces sp. YSPA8]GLF97967.1 FAD-dependent monooxygenase [Streptomyces sp. YSPA8]